MLRERAREARLSQQRASRAVRAAAANAVVEQLWSAGYCGLDIVGTFFRIVKFQPMDEELKLNFIKEIGFCHMRILDGLDSLLQLSGLIGKLCCNAGVVRK